MVSDKDDDTPSNGPGKETDTDAVDDVTGQNGGRFDRRSFLKVSGAAASAAVSPLVADRAAAATTRHGIEFDRVLNAVEDLGMDPNGDEPIDSAFASAYEEGTLVEFPPGEYRITERHVNDREVDRFGVRGLGDSRRDVQFKPPSGDPVVWIDASFVADHLIENVSFHERYDDTTQVSLILHTTGGSVIKNVEWLGQTPEDSFRGNTLTISVTDPDDVALIEDLAVGLDAYATSATYPDGVEFMWSGNAHRGEVVLRNPVIHGRNSSAIRHTNGDGVYTIEGGEFVNNLNANVRFTAGSHPSKVSSATGTYVRIDGGIHHTEDLIDAVRLHSSDGGESGAVLRDLVIEWDDVPGRGVIAIPPFGDHGRGEFYNCVVRNDGPADLPTVTAAPTSAGDDALVFENCDFTGSGGGFQVEGRPDSVVRSSCVALPNGGFDGVRREGISTNACRVPTDASALPHVLTIRGDQGYADYRVAVSGDLAKTDEGNATVDDHDTVDGATASGHVWGGIDRYRFSGEITDFSLSDPATVSLDGQEVDPSELGNFSDVLTIQGEGTPTNYEFTVSGQLDAEDGTLEEWDDVSGRTATGWVTETTHTDTFRFSGEITDFSFLEGEAAVYLNDERVDPATLETLPHALTIRGDQGYADYRVAVSGDLAKTDEGNATVDDHDTVDGATASGHVWGGIDRYRFSGEITDFSLSDPATVSLDDEEVDADDVVGRP